jgi:hypothetical protein
LHYDPLTIASRHAIPKSGDAAASSNGDALVMAGMLCWYALTRPRQTGKPMQVVAAEPVKANSINNSQDRTSGRTHSDRHMLVCCVGAALISLLGACGADPIIDASECSNKLTEQEQTEGWQLLFDGDSLAQWRSYQREDLDEGWAIENGCLARVGGGGDIISREQFGDFELKLDWRISESGNSGIFIRGDEKGKSIHHSGFEMQVLDNAGHWDARNPTHRAGAYYDMIVPDHDTSTPFGSWNSVHIIASGPHIEFWLNDRQTAKFELGSPEWETLYQASKFTDRPNYGRLKHGHIGLQDHWDKVWYRNIRIVKLPADE